MRLLDGTGTLDHGLGAVGNVVGQIAVQGAGAVPAFASSIGKMPASMRDRSSRLVLIHSRRRICCEIADWAR